ncbi:MAG TPA: hypothetical protein VHQ02_07255, partial [Usitatibacter sp.]|nr:hypothetical protein [Usitatibacter sp.]
MLWAALVSPLAATAATKMGEGFASRYSREGPFITPLDRIDSGEVGQLVIYWIQWKEHPAAHSAFRCTVTDD